jgi:hypothetical protein
MPYKAPTVDQAAYGIWGPAAAAMATARSANNGSNILRAFNAGEEAKREQRGYGLALEAANANQLAGSAAESEAALKAELIKTMPQLLAQGAGGSVRDSYGLGYDPGRLDKADTVRLTATASGAMKDAAQSIDYLGENGLRPTRDAAGRMLATAGGEEILPLEDYTRYGLITDRNKQMVDAQIGTMDAQSRRIRAERGQSDSGGGVTTTTVISPYGPPTTTVKGKDQDEVAAAVEAALLARGLKPPRGNTRQPHGPAVASEVVDGVLYGIDANGVRFKAQVKKGK